MAGSIKPCSSLTMATGYWRFCRTESPDWAGIGRTWARGGKRGRFEDWLEILHLAERSLTPEAVVISEMVTPNWTNLRPLIQGRYRALAECDIDFLTDDHRSQRSFRLFRPKLE